MAHSPEPHHPSPADADAGPGAASTHRGRLLVEGTAPSFPSVYRRLLRRSETVDVALTRLRIATLKLEEADVAGLVRFRLVLAELTTSAWEVETHRALLDPGREGVLRALIERLQGGGLEVRAAPLGAWSPDFSVFRGSADGPPTALVGPHWLEPSPGRGGPRFAFMVGGEDARRVSVRFDRLWRRAYDVGPAVGRLLGGTLAVLDRLTPPGNPDIVSAPHIRGVLPP